MKLASSTILLVLIFVTRTTEAQDAVVRLSPGGTPATLKGHTNPLSGKEYQLVVSANQRVIIHLTSTSRRKLVVFSLKRDRYRGKPLAGADGVTDWEGVFKEGGDYWISVGALRDAGEENFTLVISTPAETSSAESNISSDEATLDADKIPTVGASSRDFVPQGWKIAGHVEGDLNSDGRPDQVLQLVTATTPDDRSETDAAPEAHALLILLADGSKLRRAGLAGKLLVPIAPQYSLDLAIKKGVLSVKQSYGMSDVINLTNLFRYDAGTGRFLLIGRELYFYTRPLSMDTVKTSENYLTGVRLITRGHFRRATGIAGETTQREQMPLRKIYFEDVDENQAG